MNLETIQSFVLNNKSKLLPLGIILVGLILLSTGLIASFSSKPEELTFKSKSAGESSLPVQKTLKVDVAGAVVKPGVYELLENSRIQDALIAAGGLSVDADRGWVAKNVNLAQKIADGFKIYIPRQNESQIPNNKSQVSNSSMININSASSSDLDSLPGIGPATAQKIIEGRPYADINELISKKIVKNSVFDKIKEKISVY